MRSKLISIATSLLLVCAFLSSTSAQIAKAESCPTIDLSPLFFEEYFPGIKWDNTTGARVIRWSSDSTSINGKLVTRDFSADESIWLDQAFGSWDLALDTISFQRVNQLSDADIQVGFTAINNDGYWTVSLQDNFRASGTIEISSIPEFNKDKDGFIESAQSEIGNILGLGDMPSKLPFDSVMKDPDVAPFGSLPLSDFDIDMMRQFYGESTCHETWSPALKVAKAEVLAAQVKAAADAKAAADKATADAKALADKVAADAKALADKAAADAAAAKPTPSPSPVVKKKTITCIKGKLIKKVTAVKPVCPKGYKLKK